MGAAIAKLCRIERAYTPVIGMRASVWVLHCSFRDHRAEFGTGSDPVPLACQGLRRLMGMSATVPSVLYSVQNVVESACCFLPLPPSRLLPPTRTRPLNTSWPTPIIDAALVSPSVTADFRAMELD
jgi:hypothetical protein